MTLSVLPSVTYLVLVLLTSSVTSCSLTQRVSTSVRHVSRLSGTDIMNVTLSVRESVTLPAGGRQRLVRHFPETAAVRTDLESLKVTSNQGHSFPHRAISDRDVEIVISGLANDVVLDFEYTVYVRSEPVMEEDCNRYFNHLVYPVMGDHCTDEFVFNLESATYGDECVLRHSSPDVLANFTPTATAQTGKPRISQLSLKCFGGETCTCACSGEITDFCRNHLTNTKVTNLQPPSWKDIPTTLVIIPFFISVLLKMGWFAFFQKSRFEAWLVSIFEICLITSVSGMLFFSLIIPVHMDASIRACSTVFESQGGYFFPLLWWTYFPYVITLLITTGFIDNTELVVAMNGSLKRWLALYQCLSPICQVWFFLYNYVIPFNDALLLSGAVTALTCVRFYFRNPLAADHV